MGICGIEGELREKIVDDEMGCREQTKMEVVDGR